MIGKRSDPHEKKRGGGEGGTRGRKKEEDEPGLLRIPARRAHQLWVSPLEDKLAARDALPSARHLLPGGFKPPDWPSGDAVRLIRNRVLIAVSLCAKQTSAVLSVFMYCIRGKRQRSVLTYTKD